MKLRLSLKLFLSIIMCAVILSAQAFTQAQSQESTAITIEVSNVCSSQSFSISSIILFAGAFPIYSNFQLPSVTIGPGETYSAEGSISNTPTSLVVSGLFNGQQFSAIFDDPAFNTNYNDQSVAGGCLNAIIRTESGGSDGGTTQPPTGPKVVTEGQTLDQVLAALSASGFQISVDGSESNPKIGNVADPQLLRMAYAFSAQVIWVTAPGQLRSVINWDNANVDLDLLVFGFGACFQLNGTGILAETCDRAPFGPVPGAAFAVIIINWSLVNQPFVLSLSS